MLYQLRRYYVYFTFIIFFSCTSNYNSSYLKSIDSLVVVSDSLMFKMFQFNIDSLNLEFEKVKNYESQLRLYLDSSEVDLNIKSSLIVLGRAHKSYKSFLKKFDENMSNCSYSFKQVTDLKKDVDNNIIKEEEFIKYFNQEKEVLTELSTNLNFQFNDMITIKRLYLQEINSIDSIIKSKEIK